MAMGPKGGCSATGWVRIATLTNPGDREQSSPSRRAGMREEQVASRPLLALAWPDLGKTTYTELLTAYSRGLGWLQLVSAQCRVSSTIQHGFTVR